MKLSIAIMLLDQAMHQYGRAECDVEAAEVQVGYAIRETRRKKKISLRELARRLGISPMYLSDIERGNRFPSYDTMEKIKKKLL